MVAKKVFKKNILEGSISISKNGPYLVSNLPLDEAIMVCTDDGSPIDWKKGKKIKTEKNYALCRCGHSTNKPFCTGAHIKAGFDGTETATKENFLMNVEITEGKKINLIDNNSFCNHSGFCTVKEGFWNGVMDAKDKNSQKKIVKHSDCWGYGY